MSDPQRPEKPDSPFDRARRISSGPTSGLWGVTFIVAAGTIALSWERGRIAWTGVVLTGTLVGLIWVWARARGWPFLPW
jgi:hypothetical protein